MTRISQVMKPINSPKAHLPALVCAALTGSVAMKTVPGAQWGLQRALREELLGDRLSLERVSTSPDLPLAEETKKALAFAVHEAESMGHGSVGSEHLVLGLLLILPFVINETWLSPIYPTTHELINDWAHHLHRFMIFLIGFFVAKDPYFWRSVDKAWKFTPLLAIAAWLTLRNGQHVAGWLGPYLSDTALRFFFSYVATLYAWSCILTLLGFGQRFLNHESKPLRYLTGAIFCYYVLHQTITIIAGYYLTPLRLGVAAESLLVLTFTVAGCVVGYEVIRRIPKIGILFGVHQVSGYHQNR